MKGDIRTHEIYEDSAGTAMEVTQRTETDVHFTSQGGGFVRKMSREDFEAAFRLRASEPEYRQIEVTGDWLPDDLALAAYGNGDRWNGWLKPLFPKSSVELLAQHMPGFTYDEQRDSFVFEDATTAEDGPQVFEAQAVLIDGEPVKAYAIGDGWCWEARVPPVPRPVDI